MGEVVDDDDLLYLGACRAATESVDYERFGKQLFPEQEWQARQLLYDFSDTFINLPGTTELVRFDVCHTLFLVQSERPYRRT